MSDNRKILLLSANPKGTSKLRLDEEVREIEEGLRRSKQRSHFTIETSTAVRYRDLRRVILDHEPHIVHFSGHGEGQEELVFEDETGRLKFVNAVALSGLFELVADQVECVLLNACYSQAQAIAIAQHIPYVVVGTHRLFQIHCHRQKITFKRPLNIDITPILRIKPLRDKSVNTRKLPIRRR
ncbi:MAG: CHAT domain-containing protein [Cyanobacteria bacterium J06639_14]